MFIDYVSLLLVNMMAGYFLLAGYVYRGLDGRDQTKWVPAFGLVGVVAFVFGMMMVLTWPLPGPYNSAFGEMSVLLGVTFLGAAVCLARGYSLVIVATYAFFAGLSAVVLGISIISLGLTLQPLLSGLGFILSGLAGVFAAPTLVWLRNNRSWRALATVVLVIVGFVWGATVYPEYYMHMKSFKDWVPFAMRGLSPR